MEVRSVAHSVVRSVVRSVARSVVKKNISQTYLYSEKLKYILKCHIAIKYSEKKEFI